MERNEIIKALEFWAKNFDGKLLDFKTLCEGIALIKELTDENETLTIKCNAWYLAAERVGEEIQVIKANTVREFAERFEELMGSEFASCGFCNAVGYWSVQSVKKCIDRIAKEILNKTEDEK